MDFNQEIASQLTAIIHWPRCCGL